MSQEAAVFACGMGAPWTPWNPRPWEASPVVYQVPRCEHCFCKTPKYPQGEGPHLQCCKCHTQMAEKFVKAWFEILAPKDCA